jgi:hypothetical protein
MPNKRTHKNRKVITDIKKGTKMAKKTVRRMPLNPNAPPFHYTSRKKTRRSTRQPIKPNPIQHIGGDSNPDIKTMVAARDSFRRMFNTLFSIVYKSQNTNEAAVYEKGMADFINALKRYKSSINTLVPITSHYMPIDKKTYIASTTPLIGFVPFMCIIIYNLKNEKDVLRLLIQFRRSSGNINLTSIKGDITALSLSIELGKPNIVHELLKRGADVNTLSEINKQKLLVLMPDVVKTSTLPASNDTTSMNATEVDATGVDITDTNLSTIEQLNINQTESTDLVVDTYDISPSNISSPGNSNRTISYLMIPFALPGNNGYKRDTIPEFWAPIFNDHDNHENELLMLRNKITTILNGDNDIKMNNSVIENTWNICKLVQTMIPTYSVPTKKEVYTQNGILYNDLDIDFTHYNMLLCACLIIFGILSERMVGQKYELIFKGGKAIQLVLAHIPNSLQYYTEDIDIFIKPAVGVSYNKDEIQNLASHIGYLMEWFLSSTTLMTNMSILLPDSSSDSKRNQNIVKISYIKSKKRYDYKRNTYVDEYKPLSDVDFKELPDEIMPYFNQILHYPFYIDELQTNVLFVCPYIGALIDEKLYIYSKYMKYKLVLIRGEKIPDPSYETVTIAECDFYINKFSKAILALTYGLEQKRNPGLDDVLLLGKQKKFVLNRLDKHNVTGDLKTEIFNSLFVKL